LVVAKKKFQVESTDAVSIVLEEDGTCVDEEEYFQHGLESNSVLMLLKSGETWTGIRRSFDSIIRKLITECIFDSMFTDMEIGCSVDIVFSNMYILAVLFLFTIVK